MIKEDFLTIPDAPDYEINSKLVVRNKKTGRCLTPLIIYGNKYYSIFKVKGSRNAVTLRRQAVAATEVNTTFESIPSLNDRYEINCFGTVRNVRSKKILKPWNGAITFRDHGQTIHRRVTDLLWEVHGKIPSKIRKPISCTVADARGKKFFPHLKAAAAFIAKNYPRSINTVLHYLHQRRAEIYDWQITYFDALTDF